MVASTMKMALVVDGNTSSATVLLESGCGRKRRVMDRVAEDGGVG